VSNNNRLYLVAALAAAAMLGGAVFVAAQPPAGGSEPITVADQRELLAKTVEGYSLRDLWVGTGYRVLISHRVRPGEVEVHLKMNDVFFMQQGHAMITIGGRVEGGRVSAPDERRGGILTGGTVKRLAPGDMLFIPAGVPHITAPDGPGEIQYGVVKVEARPAA
jgi:mannose-6-phosphate isomerase-like protein (cupin superfamily)